ncbi:MAG: DUF2490 domain-containing protein [Bacteroidales bacterium]|nr:DUF2490 domain-containing protein [Candidatus Cryptobacteroides caccocaballi]
MKRLMTLLAALFALTVAQNAYSQDMDDVGDVDDVEDFDQELTTKSYTCRGRLGAQASFKLPENFQISVTEDAWFREFRSFDRLMTLFGVSYRPSKYLRFGASYGLTSIYKKTDDGHLWDYRHRFAADVTGSYTTGGWNFSLTERFQAAPRPDGYNPYKYQKADYALRTRVAASYRFERVPLEPLVSVDMKTSLNLVNPSSLAFTPDRVGNVNPRFNKLACDRFRFQGALTYRIDRRNALQLYYNFDVGVDHPVNVDDQGLVLSVDGSGNLLRLTDKSYASTAGLTYKFSI